MSLTPHQRSFLCIRQRPLQEATAGQNAESKGLQGSWPQMVHLQHNPYNKASEKSAREETGVEKL